MLKWILKEDSRKSVTSTNIEGANKDLIEEIKSYKQDLKTPLKEI